MKTSINRDDPNEAYPESSEMYVTNLSDLHLDKLQNETLSLGFKYSTAPSKMSRIDTEDQFENLYSQLAILKLPYLIMRVALRQSVSTLQISILQRPLNMIMSWLKNIKMLSKSWWIIIRLWFWAPDKGSGLAILNKIYYITKMKKIFSDTKRFLCEEKEKEMT